MSRERWFLVACVVPVLGCSAQKAHGDADAGTRALGGTALGGTTLVDSSAGGSGGVDASAGSPAGGPSASGGHGGVVHVEPPVVHCGPMDPDAGAAGANTRDDLCAPPPSICGNSVTLVYYTDGACVDGRCTWTEEQQICDYGCVANGCTFPFTLR